MDDSRVLPAFVREWDASIVRVQCPFCSRTHSHSAQSVDLARDDSIGVVSGHQVAPYCGTSQDEYRMCFPFEDEAQSRGYSWFLDKSEMKYVTIGLSPEIEDEDYFVADKSETECQSHDSSTDSESSNSESDPIQNLAEDFQAKARIDWADLEGFYQQQMQDPQYRATVFDSHCVLNEVAAVAQMLEQCKEDKLFAHRDRYGDDVMSLVAMEGHVGVMELLHDNGASISNVNNRGRTPLMEAALWGRDDAVKFLLAKGADICERDYKDRTALDLARDTDANRREREARSPRIVDSPELRLAWNRICARLEHLMRAMLPSQSETVDPTGIFNGKFMQNGWDLAWYRRAIPYELDYTTRTVGILSYDGRTKVVAAMSGTNQHRPHPQTLDNRIWTFKVGDLCLVMDFDLHHDYRDPHFTGSFHACHAEKQLLAYHIDRHFFWGVDFRNPDVTELERLKPLNNPPKAYIIVNRPVCGDCAAFVRRVREFFQIEVEIRAC